MTWLRANDGIEIRTSAVMAVRVVSMGAAEIPIWTLQAFAIGAGWIDVEQFGDGDAAATAMKHLEARVDGLAP